MNNIVIPQDKLIKIAQKAENEYVGVSCGKLDQSCEVYCRREKLLYLDNKDDSYELIPENKNMPLLYINFLYPPIRNKYLIFEKYIVSSQM